MPFRIKNGFISVSADFINKYMPSAHGEYVKVYLYGLAAAAEGRDADNESIASLLGILVTDVEKAWSYWIEKGLVKADGDYLEFLAAGDNPSPLDKSKDSAGQASMPEARPPHVTPEEISRALELNPTIKDTISTVENVLGKPLTRREITSIFNFMDWYGMDSDMVLMLFDYCVSMGMKSFSYIEKVAQGWNRDGITDIKSAEAVIKRATAEKRFQNRCKTIFGLDRAFSASELKYINAWKSELGFSPEMVAQAYEITINNTGKLAFAYMNKILMSWHQKGIKRPADIKEKDAKAAPAGKKMDEQAVIEMQRRLRREKK